MFQEEALRRFHWNPLMHISTFLSLSILLLTLFTLLYAACSSTFFFSSNFSIVSHSFSLSFLIWSLFFWRAITWERMNEGERGGGGSTHSFLRWSQQTHCIHIDISIHFLHFSFHFLNLLQSRSVIISQIIRSFQSSLLFIGNLYSIFSYPVKS